MPSVNALEILVVEDDPDTRGNLCDILNLDGHRCVLASTLSEAIGPRDWSRVGAVLLDRKLPDGEAMAALPQLKQLAPHTPVLIVTGYADLDGAIQALRAGADDYLLKPIDVDLLRASLSRIVRQRQLEVRQLEVEQALEQSEQRGRQQHLELEAIYQATPIGLGLFDRDLRLLRINPALSRMLAEQGLDVSVAPPRMPAEAPLTQCVEPLVRQVFATGQPSSEQELTVGVDQARHEAIDWSLELYPLCDERGRTIAVGCVVQDITSRKVRERRLTMIHSVTRALAESPSLAQAAPKILQAMGEESGWQVGELWQVAPAGDELVRAGVWCAPGFNVQPLDVVTQELHHTKGVGLAGAVWAAGKPCWWPDVTDEPMFIRRQIARELGLHGALAFPVCCGGEVVGVFAFFTDRFYQPDEELLRVMDSLGGQIGEFVGRCQAQESLRQQRDFAEGLIDSAQAIVLVLDQHGRVVRANSYMEQLTRCPQARVVGCDFVEQFVVEGGRDAARHRIAAALTENYQPGAISAIVACDGRTREIAWWDKALRDHDGQIIGLLSIGHDVTELREAQARALQQERLAAIGQMMTGLAHESRNALQRSQACLEMLELELDGQAEALDLVARIQKAQDHLHHLYEEVRGYAAPINLKLQACDLAQLWRDTWSHLELSRRGKTIELVEQIDPAAVSCLADPFALGQVFCNLLENALVACPDHQGRIEIDCRPGPSLNGGSIQISIRDNGPGVPLHARNRIFEPFFTTKTKGTGLGMPIARRIVEAHGGQLLLGDSASGAEFIVILPR